MIQCLLFPNIYFACSFQAFLSRCFLVLHAWQKPAKNLVQQLKLVWIFQNFLSFEGFHSVLSWCGFYWCRIHGKNTQSFYLLLLQSSRASSAEDFLGLIIFITLHKHPATQQTFDIADGTECSGFGYNLCDWSEAKLIVMSTFRVPPIT